VPNGVHLIGLGVSSPTTTSSNYFNTMIRANNTNFLAGGAAFTPPKDLITGISISTPAVATIATITVNGHTMCGTGTFGSDPDIGQDVVVLGGAGDTGFWAAYHGLGFNQTGCVGGSAPSGSTLTVTVPSGTGGCSSNCGSLFEGTPVIMMANVTLGTAQYRTQVEGVGIDCAWITGCIPLLNNNAEEHSWFRNVNFFNPGGTEYARITQVATAGPQSGGNAGSGAANSGPYLDFSGNLLNEICELSSCGGVGTGGTVNEGNGVGGSIGNGIPVNPLNCETLGMLLDGPQNQTSTPFIPLNVLKDIGSFTLTVNDPAQGPPSVPPKAMLAGSGNPCGAVYTSGTTPIGVVAYGVSTHVHGWHSEFIAAEVEVGGNQALNAAFLGATNALTPLNNLSTALATTFGVTMNDLSSFGAGGNSYQFDIGPYNVSDIDIFAISRFGTANLVKDNITNNTCNNASDLAESHYILGHGSPPKVLSSCLGVPETLSAGMKVSNLLIGGTAPTISSGFGTGASIVNSNGPAAFTLNVGSTATSAGIIGLPMAASGWACVATDRTSNVVTRETAATTTTATLTASGPWTAGDILQVNCFAY
jgi:hypothetical protein